MHGHDHYNTTILSVIHNMSTTCFGQYQFWPSLDWMQLLEKTTQYIGWGIKISYFSKGHCEGYSGGREVGVVSCGWLASTIVSTHNGLDR